MFGRRLRDVYKNKRLNLLAATFGGIEMNRKTIGTILGIFCAALVLASSPTVKADGPKVDRESLPKAFTLSKRGQGTGYSGIENPLFFKDNTRMFYGDAKKSLDDLLTRIS